MNSWSYSASELSTQQVSIRSDSQYEGQNFGCKAIFGYLSMTEKMSHQGIRAHYEQLSEFERCRIIELKEAGWANQRIARHMDRSDAAIRRCWQEWVENDRF
ncbi:uncharacterized protein TNCV_1882061 [Trichonephila clavipes]|nr:uncharacterized protein TNCV_1882061 [Trichonephila clavipes]